MIKKEDDFPHYFICNECAEAKGGTWPKGLLATWNNGTCLYCGKDVAVCSVGDWNWPDGKARGFRDD